MRWALPSALIAAFALSVGSPGSARAEALDVRDFGAEPEAWNGIGYLIGTAKEARVELKHVAELDIGTLEPGTLILAVQPDHLPDSADLVAFVEAGGYLIVAAEGLAYHALFKAFGVEMVAMGSESDALIPNALAVATQTTGKRLAESFLFFNVDAVQTNFPETMRIVGPQARGVLGWPDGVHQLVAEVHVGRGSALLISDASVFINQMLRQHYGNKQFAANALRYFCEREPCTAWLVDGDSGVSGRFDPEMARFGPLQREIRAFVARVNASLPRVLTQEVGWPWLLVILALGALPLALRLADAKGRAAWRGLPKASVAPPIELAQALTARRGAADFGALALALAEFAVGEATRRGLRRHGQPPDIVRGALARLERDAQRLRERDARGVSSEFFVRVQGDVEAVLDYLRPRRSRTPKRIEEDVR